jgi:7-carboxy-7-deazaguanine synthase
MTAGQTFPVSEIFQTIQGEASFAGTASTFIRLQGCAVGCPWCDTKYSWDHHTDDWRSIAELTRIARDGPRHVVITGGEPCEHDLSALTASLLNDEHMVQIETSGTAVIRVDPCAFVTVSPKYGMLKPVLDAALRRADEIKVPVGKAADIERARELAARMSAFPAARMFPRHPRIWLQPISQSAKATAMCVRAALEHDFALSLQTHKFVGIR